MSVSKKSFLSMLSKLKSHFDDPASLKAIDHLEKKVIKWDDSIPKKNSTKKIKEKEFPLPQDVIKAKGLALFSDGASRGNPGPGSWGAIGQSWKGDILFEASSVDFNVTNNQMELQGAIYALEWPLENKQVMNGGRNTPAFFYSDSRYVIDGLKSWVDSWKKRGWKKADNKIPENLELWQRLDELKSQYGKLEFVWVKGHSGHPQNEYCDQMANQALDEAGL